MNLSTARSEKRANEVGVRKAMGSGRSRLIIQFISEALILAFIATLVSVLLLFILLHTIIFLYICRSNIKEKTFSREIMNTMINIAKDIRTVGGNALGLDYLF